MRAWESPFNETCICSVVGTSIRSHRALLNTTGPVKAERELHHYLLSAVSPRGFRSATEYEKALTVAEKFLDIRHRVVFTHGDFQTHNILADERGHLSEFSTGKLPVGAQSIGSLRHQ